VDTYLSDLAILSREAQFAGTNIILRGTAARDRVLELLSQGITLSSGAFPGGSANNVTLFVDGRNQNLGVSYTEGLDFVANWRVPTQKIGTFTLNANATYLTRFEAAISPNGTLIDRKNTIFFPLKFKARGSVTWDLDAVRMQLTATHVGGYTNNAVTPTEKVKSYTPIDFSVGWTIAGDGSKSFTGGKLIVGFEVRNLFDIDPPYVNLAPSGNGSGGYDATAASPIGRMLAVSVRKTW
jgi:iron complex outermembrane receptor protein